MMWGNYGMTMWGWGLGALLLVGVVLLIVFLVRGSLNASSQRSTPSSAEPAGTSSPKQILDERYARGDLTTKDYRERLAALGLGSK